MEHQVPTDPATCTPLNGKVERVQRTALEESWPTVDLGDPELEYRLAEWQHFYIWDRPHGSLGGRSPIDRVCDLLREAPTGEEIAAQLRSESRVHLAAEQLACGSPHVSLKRCRQTTGF